MRVKYKDTCLIKIEVGDIVEKVNPPFRKNGVVKKIALVPNGQMHKELIALVKVQWEDGSIITASSTYFKAVEDLTYKQCFPSLL